MNFTNERKATLVLEKWKIWKNLINRFFINLYGNYSFSNDNRWDADFRMDRTTHDYWYTNNVANDFYVSGSDSMSNYTDTIVSCNVSGNKLSLRVPISLRVRVRLRFVPFLREQMPFIYQVYLLMINKNEVIIGNFFQKSHL